MTQNSEIMERIRQKLQEKGAFQQCAICGHNSWITGGGYVALDTSLSPVSHQSTGKLYPMIPVICVNCGNSHLINLITLGFSEEELRTSLVLSKDA